MDIYVMDYDILRGTKDDLYNGLFESIPVCFKNKRYINMYVESIPKEQEILLSKQNGSIVVMHVYKVVYFDRKIFVIVNNTDGDLRSMEKESKENVKDSIIRTMSS
jgi:hypothetical protein